MHNQIYEKVAQSYDENTYDMTYRAYRSLSPCEVTILHKFADDIKGEVLSVGCGSALVYEPWFAQNGFKLTGIDLSSRQIKHARENLPEHRFVKCNFLRAYHTIGDNYAGIICMYALFNFIGDDQFQALKKMYELLQPGGRCLINIRREICQGIKYEPNWCGREMYWSLPGVEQILFWCSQLGFYVKLYEDTDNKDYVFAILYKLN